MRLENEIHSSIINISSDRIINWMNAIRNSSGNDQYRLLENFWESQLKSKAWLINTLKYLNLPQDGNVYIFGGWYGVLASLIKDNFNYKNIYSIDIDPVCEVIGKDLDDRINFITSDMVDVVLTDPVLIINTSTEHIDQITFDKWLKNMPPDVPIILQGNNFFECDEHVRCCINIEEFKQLNRMTKYLMEGSLQCNPFYRWMTVGYR